MRNPTSSTVTGRVARRLNDIWYADEAPPTLLRAASAVYERAVRRRLSRPTGKPPCPVIIVGNLVVGGSGKTPVVAALAESLAQAGFAVSIISRGYGGRRGPGPLRVGPDTSAAAVGDEALELHRKTGRPVWVCRQRAAALKAAVDNGAQVVLSDDGLQHIALPRSFEICVIDARRGLGNGYCLPAGPLRQPAERLDAVDVVLIKHVVEALEASDDNIAGTVFRLESGELAPVRAGATPPRPPAGIDALAGIADPAPFFETLDRRGFALRRHPLADHQPITSAMLEALPGPIVMTEKDSVRLPPHSRDDLFVLPVRAQLPTDIVQRVVGHVREFRS